jgi:hypothetical protein
LSESITGLTIGNEVPDRAAPAPRVRIAAMRQGIVIA